MSSVCFDIVVLPVFTCYVHKFYETKTNNYLNTFSTCRQRVCESTISMYNSNQLCIEFEQRAKCDITWIQLKFPTFLASFLFYRVYGSSLGYEHNELKFIIWHNVLMMNLGRPGDILPMQVCLNDFRNWAFSGELVPPQYRWNEYSWGEFLI